MSEKEVAAFLRVSVSTLRDWRYRGDFIRGTKLPNRKVVFRQQDVHKWVLDLFPPSIVVIDNNRTADIMFEEDVCKELDISIWTLRQWRQDNRFCFTRSLPNRRVVLLRKDFERWLEFGCVVQQIAGTRTRYTEPIAS